MMPWISTVLSLICHFGSGLPDGPMCSVSVCNASKNSCMFSAWSAVNICHLLGNMLLRQHKQESHCLDGTSCCTEAVNISWHCELNTAPQMFWCVFVLQCSGDVSAPLWFFSICLTSRPACLSSYLLALVPSSKYVNTQRWNTSN